MDRFSEHAFCLEGSVSILNLRFYGDDMLANGFKGVFYSFGYIYKTKQ